MHHINLAKGTNLHGIIRLGLWETASILCEDPSMEFSYYADTGLIQVFWAAYDKEVDDYYMTSYCVITYG